MLRRATQRAAKADAARRKSLRSTLQKLTPHSALKSAEQKKRAAPIGTALVRLFARLLIIQLRGKRKCRKRKCRKRKCQLLSLQQLRCRYRSRYPAQSSDHKMRKIQLQQLRTKMLTFSFLFCFFKRVKQSIVY